MKLINTPIENVLILEPDTHTDNRGEFQELYNQDFMKDLHGFDYGVQQVSRSKSAMNVFRGLHLQVGMAKIMRVTQGSAFIYILDLNSESDTFLKTVRIWTEAGDNQMIYAPWWMPRGFIAMEPDTVMEYFHSDTFYAEDSFTIKWNDPKFKMTLPTSAPILSKKDENGQSVDDIISLLKIKYGFPT